MFIRRNYNNTRRDFNLTVRDRLVISQTLIGM